MANHTRVNLKECPWFGIDHFIDAYTDALKLGTGYDLVRYVNPQPGLEWIRRTKVPLVAVQSVMGDMGTIPEEDCETPSEGFDKYPLEKTALYIIGQIRNSTPNRETPILVIPGLFPLNPDEHKRYMAAGATEIVVPESGGDSIRRFVEVSKKYL